MDLKDWTRKLLQQEAESRDYRHSLYERVELRTRRNILDVGCGTGAVTRDIALSAQGKVTGIDLDPEKLSVANEYLSDMPNVDLVHGDALSLPFPDCSFDLVVFNIVLVYVKDQQRAVDEMSRVLMPGGVLLATLEPDYSADIDYPEDPIRELSLKHTSGLGADLSTGRRLKTLFTRAGLKAYVGIDTASDYVNPRSNERMLELFKGHWWVFEKILGSEGWSREDMDSYYEERVRSIKSGERFHFTCAFHAIGYKS